MCGIAGKLSFRKPVDPEDVRSMTRALESRGPDDEGFFFNAPVEAPSVGLGSRRLSIIDVAGGRQPISNPRGDVTVVFNGEIYNFRGIRERLEASGHRFRTSSDTEAIVHLYEEHGDDCVSRLDGMFAFALWDAAASKLLVARDRLGEKPLYYAWDGSTLAFGSELKAFFAPGGFERRVDHEGLAAYLKFGYVPDPLTAFAGVNKLPPGHLLTVERGTLSIRRYWDVEFSPPSGPVDETAVAGELLDRLRASVRARLVSDVPLGAFLSGGLDSSLVVALMAAESRRPVKTFTIGFEEAGYDERPYAAEVARRFGTEHHEEVVRPESVGLLERIAAYFDEPFGDSSCVPTYHVSRFARRHVKVVLSGDGGDELFGGYDSYRAVLGRAGCDAVPGPARAALLALSRALPQGFYGKNLLRSLALKMDARFVDYVSHVGEDRQPGLLTGELKAAFAARDVMSAHLAACTAREPLSRLQYADLKCYLPGDILVKVDRMSMMNSLEARAPYLDHAFVEFAARVPAALKLRDGAGKHILKKAASGLLPDSIIHRKKKGFSVPVGRWFKGELNGYMRQILLEPRSRRGYFEPRRLEALVADHEKGRRDHGRLLWHLLVLELWHRAHVDR